MVRRTCLVTSLVCAGALLGAACGSGRSDGEVAATVEQAIADDPLLDGAAIQIAARDGVVTLLGVVTAPVQQQQAEELARSVEGVTAVENQLAVAAPGELVAPPPAVGAPPPRSERATR